MSYESFWGPMGYDEGGLPVHLPIGLTTDGDGPADSDKAACWVCWCGSPTCPLSAALQLSAEAGARTAPANSGALQRLKALIYVHERAYDSKLGHISVVERHKALGRIDGLKRAYAEALGK